MKDQYFGDVNDYRKYGLLRSIAMVSGVHICVAWMLTPNDTSTDGGSVSYLSEPRWSKFDLELFNGIKARLSGPERRRVCQIEMSGLIPRASFFSAFVPDTRLDRTNNWFRDLLVAAEASDLVFLDPDNGLEVKSCPIGRKRSSKYLMWDEVKQLCSKGKSLLIYQHFTRERREVFLSRIAQRLITVAPDCSVQVYRTANVAFFLVLQARHQIGETLAEHISQRWGGQLDLWTPAGD